MEPIEIIKELCERHGTTIKSLEKELGYSNGSLSKATKIPADRVLDISRRFNVSMEYIMGKAEIVQKEYEPTYEDIHSLIARNGKDLTLEQKKDIIKILLSDD